MRSIKAAALMTAGRYENTYCRCIIEQALRSLGIPLTVNIGVYYGQCMQEMMEDIVGTDCDVVLTVDGDSLISARNVQRILQLVTDGKDAVAAIQARRGQCQILGTAESSDGQLVKMKTAHFGLTGLSVEALRRVEKPYFAHFPDEQGGWGENKIDDDIHFWRQWERAGNALYVDPQTCIGHLEEMVAVVGEDGKVRHMYPKEWERESIG